MFFGQKIEKNWTISDYKKRDFHALSIKSYGPIQEILEASIIECPKDIWYLSSLSKYLWYFILYQSSSGTTSNILFYGLPNYCLYSSEAQVYANKIKNLSNLICKGCAYLCSQLISGAAGKDTFSDTLAKASINSIKVI